MKQAKYFDFFDIDHYKNGLNKIAAPYGLEEEVRQARLKLSNDIYYRVVTVGREILESVLLKAFLFQLLLYISDQIKEKYRSINYY